MFARVLNMFLQRNDLISLMLDIYIGSNLNPHTKFGNIGKRTQIILISAVIVDTIPISTLMIKK